MSESTTIQVSKALSGLRNGDRSAAERLFSLLYKDLRALAGDMFCNQPPDHTLQPTALVHDAYVRLVNQQQVEWQDRAHFLAVAAQAMRNLLIDHARKRKAWKRGGAWERMNLDIVLDKAATREIDVLALHEKLQQLACLHERQARVVELRFFGGLTVDETAEVIGVSSGTVNNDWAMARAWLTKQLAGERN